MRDVDSRIDAESGTGTGTDREPGTIGVLVKAFQVLEVLAEIGVPAPLRDIARAAALPKGTIFRILQTLHGLGYVNQIEDSSFYYLTSQITYLGRNAQHEDLKLMAMPLLNALHSEFNETTNLGVLEGPFVYYLTVLEARRPLSWRVPVGTRDMFYSTALGRAIVSQLSESHRDALIKRTSLRSRTTKTLAGKEKLREALERARETGIAIDIEENDDGVVCIGAPLFIDGRVTGAISLSIPASRYTVALGEEIAERMRRLDRRFTTNRSAPAAVSG